MSEYTNDFTGYVFASQGLFAVADELKRQGWNARARQNTINEAEEHLHLEGKMLRLMTQPLRGNTHMITGQLDLQSAAGSEAIEKLAADFEAMDIPYALQVHDEAGAKVIREFGGGSPLDYADQPVAKAPSSASGGGEGSGGGCLLALAGIAGAAGALLLL